MFHNKSFQKQLVSVSKHKSCSVYAEAHGETFYVAITSFLRVQTVCLHSYNDCDALRVDRHILWAGMGGNYTTLECWNRLTGTVIQEGWIYTMQVTKFLMFFLSSGADQIRTTKQEKSAWYWMLSERN